MSIFRLNTASSGRDDGGRHAEGAHGSGDSGHLPRYRGAGTECMDAEFHESGGIVTEAVAKHSKVKSVGQQLAD